MAQRILYRLVDDIDDTDLTNGGGETVSFELDGTTYEIDLAAANAAKLRDALAPYIDAGRRVRRAGGTRRPSRTASPKGEAAAIREWARAHGHEVSAKGRIPQDVRAQYEQSQGAP